MRKRIGYVVLVLFILGLGVGTIVFFWARNKVQDFGPLARQRIIQAIDDRFDADTDLQSLKITLYPQPKLVGQGLSIRHKNWTDPEPLIYIRQFTAQTDYDTVANKRNHVDLIRLEGLTIRIPRRGPSLTQAREEQGHEVDNSAPGQDRTQLKFLIEKIIADGTLLEIQPKIEGKDPLIFDIQKLTLRNIGPGQPMAFDAELTNAKPSGLIASQGRFGPWQRDDPRSTAVSGSYNFQNADLSAFKGISGILSSTGQYHGVLQEINVDGTTDTPNFALKRGQPVHLRTNFHSVVNGTDGDTILDPVDARFLASEFICRGGVLHQGAGHGKTVDLYAVAPHARVEDILRLIMDGRPILTGAVDFKSKILIPPGHVEVLDKLRLDGRFQLAQAEFTDPKVERRLLTLSNRARGISKKEEQDEPPQTIASDFDGIFQLNSGVASFSQLQFMVPGAAIQLKGSYNMRTQAIDMRGKFRMEATLSQTQSGVKHWLLKPFDKFYKKNGAGFEMPITVSGTRTQPEIGAEVFHHRFTIH
jgi:AsmA-like C-terminal region